MQHIIDELLENEKMVYFALGKATTVLKNLPEQTSLESILQFLTYFLLHAQPQATREYKTCTLVCNISSEGLPEPLACGSPTLCGGYATCTAILLGVSVVHHLGSVEVFTAFLLTR